MEKEIFFDLNLEEEEMDFDDDVILRVVEDGAIAALKPIRPRQIQPSSLDLRLGEEGLPQRHHVVRTARTRRHTWCAVRPYGGGDGSGEQWQQ